MARALTISQKAAIGIANISTYIALNSPQRAFRYFGGLRAAMNSLCGYPQSSPILNAKSDSKLPKLVYKRLTIVLYTYDDAYVYIEAVYDARSNWADSAEEARGG